MAFPKFGDEKEWVKIKSGFTWYLTARNEKIKV
jgi:hypothetical protein